MDFSQVSTPAFITVAAIAAPAAWTDWRRRRIPNAVVLAGLLAGLLVNVAGHGAAGLGLSVAGGALGLLCLLPFHLGGAMGAGDVKLMSAMGAVLGPAAALTAAVATLVCGALLAVAWLGWHRLSGTTAGGPAAGLTLSGNPVPAAAGLPYALAIAAGSLLAAGTGTRIL